MKVIKDECTSICTEYHNTPTVWSKPAMVNAITILFSAHFTSSNCIDLHSPQAIFLELLTERTFVTTYAHSTLVLIR